jgi:hypothetical protein
MHAETIQKLGIIDSLLGLLAIVPFLPSAAFVRGFFFCIFVPLVILFSVLFSVFYFSPSLVTEMDEDNGTATSAHSRWSLFLGTVKTMVTPVVDLCSFSFLLLMLFVEMMRETMMKVCCAG